TYSAVLAPLDSESLGFGWVQSYGEHVEFSSDGGEATVHQANGSVVTFTKDASGAWSAPAWVQSTLTAGSAGTLVLTYRDQTQDVFDATSGRLLRELDRNDYATTLSYSNGVLQTVTDPAGRTL